MHAEAERRAGLLVVRARQAVTLRATRSRFGVDELQNGHAAVTAGNLDARVTGNTGHRGISSGMTRSPPSWPGVPQEVPLCLLEDPATPASEGAPVAAAARPGDAAVPGRGGPGPGVRA